jgi:hypothetical protein
MQNRIFPLPFGQNILCTRVRWSVLYNMDSVDEMVEHFPCGAEAEDFIKYGEPYFWIILLLVVYNRHCTKHTM